LLAKAVDRIITTKLWKISSQLVSSGTRIATGGTKAIGIARMPFPIGKAMFTVIAIFTSVAPYLADWRYVDLFAPRRALTTTTIISS
jgi:hypothetical protein